MVTQALLILVVGLVLIKVFSKYLRPLLYKTGLKEHLASTIGNVLYVVLLVFVVAIALQYVGMPGAVVYRILATIALAVIAVIIIFRPLIPTLPFKVGNTVEAGGLLGKVEATTILNTRLKTFDGKTVFVPNRKILDDNVINYHFTPERQVRLTFLISYRSDLLKAKQILFEILATDPRILDDPRPTVFVLNLAEYGVEMAARGWLTNLDYWRTRCDLLEKVKLRFDQEGIAIPVPQRDIRMYQEPIEA
jgi:small conductance mechanosensitive channel